ncbi:MAG: methyltransferase domain-containing protein [Candidatus Eremiobacteraeota bacterium]|nr:methyltransferase domain-containing protein [Candidatus Eremiobacteraeota bacterium]
MQQSASPFDFRAGSYVEQYQSLLVPRLFAPWARRLLDCVEFHAGDTLLDVACGPGTVTREAAQRGGKGVTGVDSSSAMLDIARVLDERATVVYLEGMAGALPVSDAAYTVVTCQQGLQFFADRAAAFAEMRRALVDRGRIAIAVWAQLDRQPFWSAVIRGLERGASPEIAEGLHKPFSFPGASQLRDEMIDAGFAHISVFTDELPIVFEGGLMQAGQTAYATPSGNELQRFDAATRQRLLEATIEELRPFESNGIVESTCSAHIAVARR